jgi:hypothetical protein
MTTYIQFSPSSNSNFTFEADLDGQTYTLTARWSLYGERYYLMITDLSGNVLLNIPMVASPNNYDISLTAGYFTTKVIYREGSNQIEIV